MIKVQIPEMQAARGAIKIAQHTALMKKGTRQVITIRNA